jgi:biopolymer transport protein ExbD
MNDETAIRAPRRLSSESPLLLTPLIDVVFLVVVFYMLSASFDISPALDVNVPEAATGTAVLDEELIVTILADGSLLVNGSPVSRDGFISRLRAEVAETDPESVLLQGDEEVPYRLLVDVMDRIRLAGLESVRLLTEPRPVPQ